MSWFPHLKNRANSYNKSLGFFRKLSEPLYSCHMLAVEKNGIMAHKKTFTGAWRKCLHSLVLLLEEGILHNIWTNEEPSSFTSKGANQQGCCACSVNSASIYLRHMQVDMTRHKKIIAGVLLHQKGSCKCVCNFGTLFHYISQLPCYFKWPILVFLVFGSPQRCFNKQSGTS